MRLLLLITLSWGTARTTSRETAVTERQRDLLKKVDRDMPRNQLIQELGGGQESGLVVIDAFAKEVARLGAGGAFAVALDVGANDGGFSRALKQWVLHAMPASRRYAIKAVLRQSLIEPQPRYADVLTQLATLHGWRVLAGAAVGLQPASGTVNLTLSQCGTCVSAVRAMSNRYNPGHRRGRRITVPAIGLAQLIAESTRGAGASLLKVDIEGGEYELLPQLLASGALCKLTHLLLEWHLNPMPPDERFAAFALRHSIEPTLRAGCARAPLVEHNDYGSNNLFVEVPGLDAEAHKHRLSHMAEFNMTNEQQARLKRSVDRWHATHRVAAGELKTEPG